MAKKPKANNNPAKAVAGQRKITHTASPGNASAKKYTQLFIIAGIALATFASYATITGNELTNWDDLGYIIVNPLIRDISWEGIKAIFSTDNPVMGNYHPLTILLYAFEYRYYQLDPFIYHLDSLILHVLGTIAAWFFVRTLTRDNVAAIVASLLFGVHTMHVESVAWAAGRKDVLYGLFFIMSCTAYLHYIRSGSGKKWLWYIACITSFILSLLSKSVAVSLPVTLLLIDYFERRAWSWKIIIEKIPHFSLSLIFGLLSVEAQKKIGALGSLDVSFTIPEHFALGAYTLITYLWKAILPANLSNFYPYPLKQGNAIPGIYYIFPIILAALIFVIWRYGRKNRTVLFGLGFFTVNIFLLLQFIPVGGAIMSDRYGYIPYLGLFIMAGMLAAHYYNDTRLKNGRLALGVALCCCLALGIATNARCKDWHDSISLWTDDREKHPEAPVAYFYLGQAYNTRYDAATDPKEKQTALDSTLFYYTNAIYHKPDYINAITCLAEVQRGIGQINEAKANYRKAQRLDNGNEHVYVGLGVVYAMQHQYDSAEYCFQKALTLQPMFAEAHSNYANFLDITGRLDSSLAQYAIAIAQRPESYIPYMNRAKIFLRLNKPDDAIADYTKVIQLNPGMGEAYYLRSRVYAVKGNRQQAIQDVEKAKALSYPGIDPNYYSALKNN